MPSTRPTLDDHAARVSDPAIQRKMAALGDMLRADKHRRLVEAQPDSDGYVDGARDRALVLDYIAHGDPGQGYPAWGMHFDAKRSAQNYLLANGYAVDAPHLGLGRISITPAGRAAHAATQRALSDLIQAVDRAVA